MRQAVGEFLVGAKDYWRAVGIIRAHGLWRWVVVPGLVGLAYFPGVLAGTLFLVDDMERYLRERWLPAFARQPVYSWTITFGLWLACLYAGFLLFRNVIMILYAPVLGKFSALIEEKVEGSKLSVPPARFWPATFRAVGMSLLSLMLSLASLLAALFLLVVPILGGLLMPVVLLFSQMFLGGHGFMDPTLERHGYGVGRSLGLARKRRWRTMGCGGGFVLLSAIPVVGWFLGPTIGVVAGTLAALDLESKEARALA